MAIPPRGIDYTRGGFVDRKAPAGCLTHRATGTSGGPASGRGRRRVHALAARAPGTEGRAPLALAEPDRLGGDLDQLVVVDPGEAFLETHRPVRAQPNCLVVSRGAHVGELLLAA